MGKTVKFRFGHNDRPVTAVTMDGTMPSEPSGDGGRARGASGKILKKYKVDGKSYDSPYSYFLESRKGRVV